MKRRVFLSGLSLLPLLVQPAHGVVQPKRKPNLDLPLLVLDPGHGGRDPGAVSASGVYEKDIVLDIAHRLAGELKGVVNVKLTREDDRFLELDERVAFARAHNANLFVSIHADSAPTKEARGLSAYTLSDKATDRFAAQLADDQNFVDERFGGKKSGKAAIVSDILVELTAQQTVGAARYAKQQILGGVEKHLTLLEHPARAANFVVLRAPDVPSLLIETGFLSNPLDEAALSDAPTRGRLAQVLGRELGQLLQDPLFT